MAQFVCQSSSSCNCLSLQFSPASNIVPALSVSGPSSTLSESAFLPLCSCLHLSSPHFWDFSLSALLFCCVQTLTELRKAFSSLIRAPSIRNANTCDCVTRWSPATSAGANGEPLPSHTHCAPCLWAFTHCHYFIVSLHACDWAVRLTLCCSNQATCSPHTGPEGNCGGCMGLGKPFPRTSPPVSPSGLLHTALPLALFTYAFHY